MNKTRRKNRRVKKSRNKILYLIAGLVAAIFIFTAGTMALLVSEEIEKSKPPKRIEEPHLIVEDVFFMKTFSRSDTEKIDITTTVYITNDGLADAERVKIIAFPVDDKNNLASDKCKTSVGNIYKQKTAEAEFMISVPTGSKNEVELLIFEDDRLILSGTGSVVIQGTHSNVQKYQTHTVSGTQNDKDYDGIPDTWELYYGMNPSDPNDALKDFDNDGSTNLDEYRGNTTPCEPKDDGEEEGLLGKSADSTAIGGLIIAVLIIIIIIIIVGAVAMSNPNKKKPNNKNNQKMQPGWPNQNTNTSIYHQPQYPTTPWLCPKCGGWMQNDVCTRCGGQYSVKSNTSVQKVNSNDTHEDDVDND